MRVKIDHNPPPGAHSRLLEELFQTKKHRLLHSKAPLLAERERFLSDMLDRGICRERVRVVATVLLHLIRIMELEEMRTFRRAEVESAAELWLTDPKAHASQQCGPTSSKTFTQTALRWLRFHDAIDATPLLASSLDATLASYVCHLTSRQLAQSTIRSQRSRVYVFFEWLRNSNKELSTATLQDVDQFLDLKRTGGWTIRTRKAQCETLRTFFQYAEAQAWTMPRIARGISLPRVPRYDPAPKGPSWREVRRLLSTNRGKSLKEMRIRVILALCAIYALRVSEVVNLTLDDFDWFSETFVVRRVKNGRIQRFPIQFEVGDAILAYLQYGRPSCKCRSLLVTEKPPFHGIGQQTVRNTVKEQMKLVGIDQLHLGPHSLRHACATQLLRKGSSMQAIADFLGHGNITSVCIYAKFDMRSLTKVANFSLTGVR